MKKIPLSQGFEAIVDDGDYELVSKFKWSLVKAGGKMYARRIAYTTPKLLGRGKNIYLHRFILKPEGNLQIDHIDGNGLNNTRANIRVCTRAENLRNRRVTPNILKGLPKGVSYFRDGLKKPWIARISTKSINQKSKHLGYFETAEEAAKAYNDAAILLYGEFAYLNERTGS